MKFVAFFLVVLVMTGCGKTEQKQQLNGARLLEQKCASCHNTDLPPKTYDDEVAPPMMAVAFHVKDFMQVSNESERVYKARAFVEDFVLHPSKEKSLCDKKSLQSYGLMPSQKGKVTKEELEAIAKYMFEHFTVKNLTQAQAIEAKMRKMPKGQKLALKYNCLGCHTVEKNKVGPSFCLVAKQYGYDAKKIALAIAKGSSRKYENITGKMMPSFQKVIPKNQREILAEWIATCTKQK